MKRIFFLSSSLFLMLFCSQVLAESSFYSGRADISYSEANPDYSPFSNGEGFGLYGRIEYNDEAIAFFRQSDASFQPSGPVSGDKIDTWRELGLGYQYAFNQTWLIEGALSYHEIEQGSNNENGHEFQLGARFSPYDSLSLDLSLGKLDLQIDDWNLDFEARYTVFESIYLTTKLRDYADWDFTYYEVGLGSYF